MRHNYIMTPEQISELLNAPKSVETDGQVVVERSFADLREGLKLQASAKKQNPFRRIARVQYVLSGAVSHHRSPVVKGDY